MVFHPGRSFFQYQPGKGVRVGANHRFQCLDEAVQVDGSGEFVQGGLLVVASFRIEPLARQVDAQLGLGEGIRHGRIGIYLTKVTINLGVINNSPYF